MMGKLLNLANRLVNIGVTNELEFSERKKTRMLNLLILFTIPIMVTFLAINHVQHHYATVIINYFLLAGCILFLVINYYRKFMVARWMLAFVAAFFYTANAIMCRNGGEYYLIALLVINPILFQNRIILVITTLVNIALFLGVTFIDTSAYAIDPLPRSRMFINILVAFVIILIAVYYFKLEHLRFQKEVERGKEELEEKNRQLEALNNTKEKLFSIIAHDLHSPIAQLKGSLNLISYNLISQEKFQELSGNLSLQVNEVLSTMDNMLSWSHSQLQGIYANPKKVSVEAVLNQVLALLKENLDKKRLTIRQHLNSSYVWVDPDHLLLVLRNLISNAAKYSYREGVITVRAFVQDQQVIIIVSDTGCGMDKHTLKQVFLPELVVSRRGTENEKGTGLGLKLCKEFIDLNHGSIRVESEEQKGSTFSITLPSAK